MSDETAVYDLGAVDFEPEAPVQKARPRAMPRPPVRRPVVATPSGSSFDSFASSLELFLPGSGRLLRGQWSSGLFVLSAGGFLIALGWAVWETLDRLSGTLIALGYSAHGGVFGLALIYACFAGLHAGNVLNSTSQGAARVHPLIAGIAAALLPGWGQLLNRQPVKAATFVAGVWIVGLAWLLASPWTRGWLESEGLIFRPGLERFSSPVVLWTVPVVLWALSIYDAVATARR